jgi:Zn-finger nucleic acid-binding protein
MADHQVNEIDHCQKYGGIWLDRAKLYKMIERSSVVSIQSTKYDRESHTFLQGMAYGTY